jgi:hypothetical protein
MSSNFLLNFRLKKTILLFLVLTLIISGFGFGSPKVFAATYTITKSCNLPLARTFWTKICQIDSFDTSLGELIEVKISLNTNIQTNARAENLDSIARQLNADFGALVEMQDPVGQPLFSTVPKSTIVESFPGYDDTLDFGGVSGKTYTQLTASAAKQTSFLKNTSPTQVDWFKNSFAGSKINMNISADSYLNFNNGLVANFATVVETFAAAQVDVVYSYLAQDLNVQIIPPNTITPGENSNLQIKVINKETEAISGPIIISFPIPTGLTLTNPNISGVSLTINNNIATISINPANPITKDFTFDLGFAASPDIKTDLISITALIQGDQVIPTISNRSTNFGLNIAKKQDSSSNSGTNIVNSANNINTNLNLSPKSSSKIMNLVRTGGSN